MTTAVSTSKAPVGNPIEDFSALVQSWNDSVRTPELAAFPQVSNSAQSLLTAGASLMSSYRNTPEPNPERMYYFAAALKVCDKLAVTEPDLARGFYEEIYYSAPKHLAPLSPLLELPAPEGDTPIEAECRQFFSAIDKLNLGTTPAVIKPPTQDYLA